MDKVNLKYSALSGNQLSLFKDFTADELQSYITQIQAIKSASNGMFNATAVQGYSQAIQGLEAKQAALLLSTQGLTNAQIAETLAFNESNVAKNYQAMVDAGLLKSKQSLTLVQVQENLQTVLGAEADTSATMASLGLSAAIEGQEHQTVQLSAKKLQEAVATNVLTEAQAQELAMRTGVILSMNKQATGSLPKWIAILKACTVAVWGQVKATAVWLATTPAGWATTAVAALGAVIFGLNEYAKSAKKASDNAIDVYEKSREKIQSNKEEAQSLNDLIEKYKELESASDIDSDVRAEIKEIQYDIMDLVGAEADNLDLVNGKLNEQLDKLKAIQTEKSKQNVEDAKDAYYNALRVSDIMTGNADSYGNDVSVKWNGIEAGQIHKVNGFERINYKDFVDFITENGFGDIFRKNNNENIFSMKFVVDTTDIDSLEEKVARLKEFKEFLAENGLRSTGLYEGVTDAINRYEEQFDSEAEASKNLVNAVIDDLALSNEKLTEASVDSVEAFEKYRQMMIEEVQKDVSIGEMLADGILSEEGLETAVNSFMATAEGFSEWYELWKSEISESSDIEEPKWDFSTTLENLDKVSEKLEILDKSFAKLFDKDEYIGWEDLASISEAFKDMEGIEDYVKRIQEAGQDTEKVSEVFGELTGKYLEHAGVLSNVTEENAALIASMLIEMGIANAEEIVYVQLNETAETLALKKRFLAETGYELVDATLAEVAQFLNEVDASNEAKQALAQLALEKVNLSNINFDESSNIDQLISLANVAGASAMAIAKAKQAIATINSINEKGANGSAGDFKRLDYASKTLNDIKNHTYDWQYEKLNANDFKINSSPKSTPKYKGGTNTNKAVEQAKKDAEKESKKAAKESEDTFEKTIDFFKQRVEVLTAAFDNLEKGMENVFGSGAKNTLLSAQIGILDEEVNNYTDALAMYRKKASDALSGIDSELRDKIVNGAVQITDFIGKGNEDVVEAIEDYQGWADEVSNCTQKLEELKTQIRQLELQKFNNIADDFADQFDLRDSGKDLLKKEIDLIEESNRVVSDSLYKAQIDQTQKQLEILNKEKAALADQMASALKSGNIDTGTDEWLEMVDKLSEVEGSILDCETAIEEFNNAIKQLEIDKFDRIADHFTNLYDGLEEANTMAKKQIDLIKESGLVVSDSLYQSQISQSKKQLELLKQEEQSLKDQLSKALDSGYIESGSDEWLEMMKSIQGVEESILDCETAIEEFNNEIKQLEVDKFNRIADHYNDLRDSLNSSNDLISKQIGLLEEAGELVGASYYTAQIDQLKKQLDLLDQERKSLSDQLNTSVSSRIIKEGSDEWLEMMRTIQEVDGNILDCQTSIEEFDNAILNIHTNIFDRIQNQFSDLDSELSNLRGLFDDLEVSDDKGVWTKEGLAQLGLLAQQYELAEYRVKQYNDEINDLTAQYLAGRYSVTEYTDRLSELTSAQWDAVNASENIKDAIIELNEVRINKEIEGIEKEIDAFKELTDAQIKALDSAKALKDYQDSIAEKSKAVADIERQLAAMQYDNSASTIAKRKLLEEQLTEAEKALTDAEYDHSIETQKDALNQQYEAFEAEKNAEIEALRASLEQRELLISESFANLKANTETIATEISEIANNHGITVSNTLIDAWKSGENAITSYGETLQTESDLFIQQLLNVENGVYELQEQADQSSQALSDMFATQADNLINELNRSYDSENQLIQESYYLQDVLADMFATQADGLINELQSAYASENQLIMESYNLQDVLARMFGTRADNLVNELMSSYYSEANLNAMTNTLQNSLINTLERGYNINGITSALSSIADGANSVADAANKAAQALANMGAAQTDYGSASDSDTKHGFKVYDSHTGKLKDIIYSEDWDVNDLRKKYDGSARGIRVQKFAKGGIVSKEDDGIFDPIAKSLGEDTMVAVKYGEGIISAEEMKKMNKLSEALAKIDSDLLSPSYIRPGIQPTIPEYVRTERPNITLHYDRMFEFNGDFNNSEQLLRQMEKVATNSTTKILDEINRDFRIHGK